MFLKVIKVKRKNRIHKYLVLAESYRENGKPTWRILRNFGSLHNLNINEIRNLAFAFAKFSRLKLTNVEEKLRAISDLKYGDVLVIEHLWNDLRLDTKFKKYLSARKIAFEVALAIKLMVINRLIAPKSKLSIVEWQKTIYLKDLDGREIQYHQFLRALDYFYKIKEPLEQEIFYDLRDLFNLKLNLVFYDLTSTYFEGQKCSLAEFGYSRDHRSDAKQIILGLLVTDEGLPIAHEVFKGNRADKTTLKEAIDIVKRRFQIKRCIFVCDRGVVSEPNIELLEKEQYEYIFALRKRQLQESEILFNSKEPFVTIEENLKAKEIVYNNRRYVLCHNLEKEQDDRNFRNKLIERTSARLERLKKSKVKKPEIFIRKATKILTKLKASKFFTFKVSNDGNFEYDISESVLNKEESYDGKYILMTNIKDIPVKELIKTYKNLSQVESAFRTIKDFLHLRPIYHYSPERVCAHVFVCVLAYLLEKIFAIKLKQAKLQMSPATALEKLDRVRLVINEFDNRIFKCVTELSPQQNMILKSCGIDHISKMFY